MTGIIIASPTGEEFNLRSTKEYPSESAEKLQLMVEDLLFRAHRSGDNVWAEPAEGLVVGGVWTTEEKEKESRAKSHTAFGQPTGESGVINPPALGNPDYAPQGQWQLNPVLNNSVLSFADRLSEAIENPGVRILFDSADDRYPSLIIERIS